MDLPVPYSWPPWFNSSSLSFSECTMIPLYVSRPPQTALPCSSIPWGLSGRRIKSGKLDESLTWDPLSLTPPWFLRLPPYPTPPCIKACPPITIFPLRHTPRLVTWNSSLAINVTSSHSWSSFFYPILRAAMVSWPWHNMSSPITANSEPPRSTWACHVYGNCLVLATPAPVGTLWACSDGILYTALPAVLTDVDCFLTDVVFCPPLYAHTASPHSPSLHRHLRTPVWSQLTDRERVAKGFEWAAEGYFAWGVSIVKARVAIATLAELVKVIDNATQASLRLLNKQLQDTSRMTLQNRLVLVLVLDALLKAEQTISTISKETVKQMILELKKSDIEEEETWTGLRQIKLE
ncbi:uncharacterized protein LOC112548763 [Alligator sinensis]|uniref:Uncharacterized protein LOC112548763 n=1 Tax=Alligator sinensis TaxID=38654 RepID=A0A3Q0FV32_ALLSI|nr:uncharacterized protein LOC112548763 [Alligator sinensis]